MRAVIKKYRWLLVAEVLCILMTLPMCFAKEELIFSQTGQDILVRTDETGQSADFISEEIALTPGVYQLRVRGEIPQGALLSFSLQCEECSFQALRCNGALLFPEQQMASVEAYVLESTDSAYIRYELQGIDPSAITSASLYKTNLGGRILCFCIMAGSLLLNFLCFFREQILAGKVSRQQQVAFWLLSASVAVAYFPYLTDYYSFGADTAFHMLRIEGLKETLLWGGQFPVRVQSYWLYDHGYAVSTFYGDLFLLIPAFFRMVGFSIMTAYKLFVLLVMIATAGISYYSFRQCTHSTYAALFGSVIYMLAPYRIYNFYNRGAVGEYLGMTFLPLVLCGMYRLYAEKTDSPSYAGAKVPLIVGLSCILQSHLLTCEMTVVFMALACVIMWKKTLRWKTFLQLAETAVISLLVNCWFWLPLLFMMGQDAYQFDGLVDQAIQSKGTKLAGIFQLYPNMGAAQTGMYHCEPIQIGAAALLLLCVFFGLLWRKGIRRKRGQEWKNPYDRVMVLLAGMSLAALFMSTSTFPWDWLGRIPGIRFLVTSLQFPTRLLSPASAFCAMFAAFFVVWLREECRVIPGKWTERSVYGKGFLLFTLILAAFSAFYHVNDIAYESGVIRLYNVENMGTISVVNGEYLLQGTTVGDYFSHGPVAEEGLTWSSYEKQGVNISICVENTSQDELHIELPLIGYKGYAVESSEEGEKLPYITEERGNHGDLRIAVPAGYRGNIKVAYEGFLLYRAAETVSLVTMSGLALYMAGRRRWRWIRKRKQ